MTKWIAIAQRKITVESGTSYPLISQYENCFISDIHAKVIEGDSLSEEKAKDLFQRIDGIRYSTMYELKPENRVEVWKENK